MIQQPDVFEFADRSANQVTFHIVCRTGAPTPKHVAMSRILSRVLPDGTAEFRRDALRALASKMSCTVSEGLLVVRFGVSPGEYKTGVKLTETLLSKWQLDEARVQELVTMLPFEKFELWQETSLPFRADYRNLNARQIAEFWNSLPKSVSVAGDLGLNTPKSDLKVPAAKPLRPIADSPQPLEKRAADVTTIEWRSEPITISTNALLAAIALGGGQQSSLFRCWRQQQGWTYRQDGVLSPIGTSWHLRLIAYRRGAFDDLIAKGLDLVKTDIESWTEETLKTAWEVFRSYQKWGFETRTIEVAGQHIGDFTAANQGLLAALGFAMPPGEPSTDLAGLKATALSMLLNMKLYVIRGS